MSLNNVAVLRSSYNAFYVDCYCIRIPHACQLTSSAQSAIACTSSINFFHFVLRFLIYAQSTALSLLMEWCVRCQFDVHYTWGFSGGEGGGGTNVHLPGYHVTISPISHTVAYHTSLLLISRNLMKTTCYCIPMLEYNSVTCSPYLNCDIMQLKKVQRKFTKRLRGFKRLTCEQRVSKLGHPSLALQRLHLDIVYCYKIVFGLVALKCPITSNWLRCRTPEVMSIICTNHDMTVALEFNLFANGIINIWKRLIASVNFASLSTFESTVRRVDFSQFLKCNSS